MKWFVVRAAVVRLLLLVALAAAVTGIVVAIPAIQTAHAAGEQTNQFTITSFDAAYALSRDADGSALMTVTETIVADFPSGRVNHGILRGVPTTYRGRDLDVSLISVRTPKGTDYEVDADDQGGHLVWRIGSASTYVSGPTTYVITYQVRHAVQTFGDHQELYWDVNGDEWLQPVGRVSMTLTLDPDLAAGLTGELACYLPSGGRCGISADGATVTAQSGGLSRGQTMTVAVGFVPGTVVDPGGLGLDAADLAPIGLGIGGGALALTLLWLVLARYRAGRIGEPLVAESTPPDDLSPAAAACLLGRPERAVTAELLNQAVLGSIRLSGEGRRIRAEQVATPVFPDGGDDGNLAKVAIRTAFGGGKVKTGDSVYDVAAAVRRYKAETLVAAYRRFSDNLAFGAWTHTKSPMRFLSWLLFATAGVVALIMVPRTSVPVALVALAALLVAAALIRGLTATPRLSAAGRQRVGYLRGMQMFIRTADTHRLATMQSAATAARGPNQSIELYEKLLGWAVALGVEDSWLRVIGGLPATAGATSGTSLHLDWLDGDPAALFGPADRRHRRLSTPVSGWTFAGYQTSAAMSSGWTSTRDVLSSWSSSMNSGSSSSGGGSGWSSGSSGGSGGGGFSGGGGGGGGGGGW